MMIYKMITLTLSNAVMAYSAKSIALISAVKIDTLLGNYCFMDMLFMIDAHPTLSLTLDPSV